LGFIGLGYGAVLVVAAAMVIPRYLYELRHPDEVLASSGMYAFGDFVLAIFIVCLLAIPTVFLIWVAAKFEAFYETYSQVLLSLSLSAPVCLGVVALGESALVQSMRVYCFLRLFWSPLILVGMGVSRLAARFERAKKLVSYALLVEGVTLAASVALLIHAWVGSNGH
jgi:hypothetical protein